MRFGEPPSAESTVIVLEARSLHTLFLGLLNPARALHEGEILVRGPRSHAVQRILPLFRSVLAPLYVDQLREKDRLDLVPEALQPLTSDSEGAP